MRSILKFAFIAIIGLISYNYFYGNEEEKARSEKVVEGVKDVFISVKDLVKSEKEKLDEGKYDSALDKIGGLFKDFKEKTENVSEEVKDRLADLEEEKEVLQDRIEEKKKGGIWSKEDQANTQKDFEALIKKTEELFQDVE